MPTCVYLRMRTVCAAPGGTPRAGDAGNGEHLITAVGEQVAQALYKEKFNRYDVAGLELYYNARQIWRVPSRPQSYSDNKASLVSVTQDGQYIQVSLHSFVCVQSFVIRSCIRLHAHLSLVH
jgi:hypothetical protein